MNEHEKRYELIINNSVNILKVFTIIAIFISFILVYFNSIYQINKIWNISFLIPMYITFFSSIIQLMICFWKCGVNDYEQIEKFNRRKSGLIFSSTITYFVFLGMFFMYILMSIILF